MFSGCRCPSQYLQITPIYRFGHICWKRDECNRMQRVIFSPRCTCSTCAAAPCLFRAWGDAGNAEWLGSSWGAVSNALWGCCITPLAGKDTAAFIPIHPFFLCFIHPSAIFSFKTSEFCCSLMQIKTWRKNAKAFPKNTKKLRRERRLVQIGCFQKLEKLFFSPDFSLHNQYVWIIKPKAGQFSL